jgi:hypothetical protein
VGSGVIVWSWSQDSKESRRALLMVLSGVKERMLVDRVLNASDLWLVAALVEHWKRCDMVSV